MKGRWKSTKKGIKKAYTVIRDKATALKKSVTCKKKNSKTTHNMILTNQYHGYIKGNSKLGKTKFTNQKQTKSTKIIGVSLPVVAIGTGLLAAGLAGGVIAGGSGAITASRGTSLVSKGLKGLQKLIKTGVKLPPAVKKGFKIGFTLAVPSTVMGTISDISSKSKASEAGTITARPEKAVLGSKKHGVKWTEGAARAKAREKPKENGIRVI